MSERHPARIRILFGVFIVAALLILGKLYFIQIVDGDDYTSRADRQYVAPKGTSFDRGAIYFSDKTGRKISAATLASGYVLAVNSAALVGAEQVFDELSEYVALDKEIFMAKVADASDTYIEVAKRVDKETADAISALELPGVSLHKEQWRLYPGGDRAAHALGFVGFDGDTLIGRYGLERYYQHVLSRKESGAYRNFFAEIFSDVGDVIAAGEGEGEGDLVTTIEPTVQGALEKKLDEVMEGWSARSAGGIIMNPKTGEIYAMGALPTFDPNTFSSVDDIAVFSNPLVEGVYEMGSIMKPITMAAGLDAHVITPDTTYNDKGSLEIDGRTVSNYDGKARGTASMYEVLGQSLNTGVAFVVGELGNKRFSDYFRAFGFGEESGIDLPGEADGLTDNLESSRDIEHVTASYGQGMAVTPIAMTRALSALGNGGMLVTPHIVKEIEYEVGITKSVAQPSSERVISDETSKTITRMLVRVVDEYLLGGTVKLDRYSVAAKTGTAQIPEGNGYSPDRYLHSFFGYFPAYDPEFIVFLYVVEPQGVNYASETLTRPFMDITEFLINYYEIPPDR